MSKGVQIAIGGVAVVLLLGWYGISALESGGTYQYFQTLEEFLETNAAPSKHTLRVHGYVATGSIERDVAGKRVHFAVQNDPPHSGGPVGRTLSVIYTSLETPDLFKDGAEVVVEGNVHHEGGEVVFVADNVLAKCPSKFEAKVGAEAAQASL